ncbi:hypothetical protein [Dasania marina]
MAVLGETRVDDKSALKLTILNPCLTMADFEALFNYGQCLFLASQLL